MTCKSIEFTVCSGPRFKPVYRYKNRSPTRRRVSASCDAISGLGNLLNKANVFDTFSNFHLSEDGTASSSDCSQQTFSCSVYATAASTHSYKGTTGKVFPVLN
jgi:hypothetical protein